MNTKSFNIKLSLWCGYDLDAQTQRILTNITMMEFNKDVKDRRLPFQLVEEARAVKYFTKKWRTEYK